jgi:integrase
VITPVSTAVSRTAVASAPLVGGCLVPDELLERGHDQTGDRHPPRLRVALGTLPQFDVVVRRMPGSCSRRPTAGAWRIVIFGRPFYRARALAGRQDVSFHGLRHAEATLAAAAGATLAELMARMGHSTVGAALKYQHAVQDRDAVIAAALSDLANGTIHQSGRRQG